MPKRTANPNPEQLYQVASLQGGYFTAKQAKAVGYTKQNIAHHVNARRFERVSRGFYRLREFPAQPHEDVIAAWVKAGPNRAVVSHETALALYELSAVRPRKISLTVPRDRRPAGNRPQLPAVSIHTTTRPFGQTEVVERFGVRITSPARTITDAAEAGTDPSFIIEAVGRAIDIGLVTVAELLKSASGRSEGIRQLINRAIEEASRHASVR